MNERDLCKYLHDGDCGPCAGTLVLALPSDPGLEPLQLAPQRPHLQVGCIRSGRDLTRACSHRGHDLPQVDASRAGRVPK